MRRGDLSVRAVLRSGDLLTEVADELNAALDDLERDSRPATGGVRSELETATVGE